jgi:hypothetical protein
VEPAPSTSRRSVLPRALDQPAGLVVPPALGRFWSNPGNPSAPVRRPCSVAGARPLHSRPAQLGPACPAAIRATSAVRAVPRLHLRDRGRSKTPVGRRVKASRCSRRPGLAAASSGGGEQAVFLCCTRFARLRRNRSLRSRGLLRLPWSVCPSSNGGLRCGPSWSAQELYTCAWCAATPVAGSLARLARAHFARSLSSHRLSPDVLTIACCPYIFFS